MTVQLAPNTMGNIGYEISLKWMEKVYGMKSTW